MVKEEFFFSQYYLSLKTVITFTNIPNTEHNQQLMTIYYIWKVLYIYEQDEIKFKRIDDILMAFQT